ncbi:hypothetical protein VTI28DRAFT_10126 [Corynascus sepedonium]
MPPTRIPTKEDFAPIFPSHPTYRRQQHQEEPISLVYPDPPESTTSILLLFHGLGDSERPFAAFARNLRLPGVLAVSVRGTAPLPPVLLPVSDSGSDTQGQGYHWGDDLTFTQGGDAIDPDPGFDHARAWIMDRLVGEVLVGKCGWELEDLLIFGFGQGGAFGLGLASSLRKDEGDRVVDVTDADADADAGHRGGRRGKGKAFKGVVSVGGGLPMSMVPSVGGLGKAKTPVLVCCGRESEAVDEDAEELLEGEFEQVKVVRWKRNDDGMPRNREEVLPMMQFFADRLRSGWL